MGFVLGVYFSAEVLRTRAEYLNGGTTVQVVGHDNGSDSSIRPSAAVIDP